MPPAIFSMKNMSKKNQKAHLVRVTEPNGYSDLIVCISYDLDDAGQFRGFEYSKLLTAIDSVGLGIPYDRQATFKEELRVLDKAADASQNTEDLESRIKDKISGAYDSTAKITVNAIK
jgi:hypothetical protein